MPDFHLNAPPARLLRTVGYAVRPTGEAHLCFTSAPDMLGAGDLYQIYTNRADAEFFCASFTDRAGGYAIVEVSILYDGGDAGR